MPWWEPHPQGRVKFAPPLYSQDVAGTPVAPVSPAGLPDPPLTSRTRVPFPRLVNRVAIVVAFAAAVAAPGSASAAPSGHQAFAPIWGVQVGTPNGTPNGGLDPAVIHSLHAKGVNALVVDVQRLGAGTPAVKSFEAIRTVARQNGVRVIALMPEAHATSPVLWHVAEACKSGADGVSCAV